MRLSLIAVNKSDAINYDHDSQNYIFSTAFIFISVVENVLDVEA